MPRFFYTTANVPGPGSHDIVATCAGCSCAPGTDCARNPKCSCRGMNPLEQGPRRSYQFECGDSCGCAGGAGGDRSNVGARSPGVVTASQQLGRKRKRFWTIIWRAIVALHFHRKIRPRRPELFELHFLILAGFF